MNSCGASPREEQDNRLCVGCYYILDHSLSGLFILHKGGLEMAVSLMDTSWGQVDNFYLDSPLPKQSICYNLNKKIEKREKQMDPQLVELSARLTEVALKTTATSISSKLKAVKQSRDDKKIIAEMNDMIYELLDDKQELEAIAKSYQEEFIAQKLSEDDLKYISSTVLPIMKKFLEELAETQEVEERLKTIKLIESLDAFESLLSINTLNVLQLIGFNFKKGIGEPLTELIKNSINGSNKKDQIKYNELIAERDIEYFKLIQDKEAYDRFMSLRN
ncbi:hypothetical protein EB64_01100 [Enterococcus faecium]|nr:hypothetical protein EB64_01100 [Enterococcus faecium]